MTIDQVRKDIQGLTTLLDKRVAKYQRNVNRWSNGGMRRDSLYTFDGIVAGYYQGLVGEQDTGTAPTINVCKSIVDAETSKLVQTKVRPFFDPVNGTYKTRKVCRNSQIYFDQYFYMQKINQKIRDVVRDALVCEVGYLWVDEESKSLKHCTPWDVYFDPAEYHYGKITHGFIKHRLYPISYLAEKIEKSKGEGMDKWRQVFAESPTFRAAEYTVHYDIHEMKRRDFLGSDLLAEYDLEEGSKFPIGIYWAYRPIKGSTSNSSIDNVISIQTQIDSLSIRLHEALELTPANAIFVQSQAGIKPSQFTNRIGAVYEVKAGVQGSPVSIVTPAPIDGTYIQMLDYYENKAYNMEGISQLSAQSKKPSGLNSGVALDTLEDVESERHEVRVQDLIQLYMDIAEIMIANFPATDDILPQNIKRPSVKWGEIKEASDQFSIQFSAASSLSKDPKTKMEQIEKLIAMKLIDPSIASTLLEMPDLEDAYGIQTASYDACQRVIERAIDDGTVDFFEVINLNQLFAEACNTMLRLDANDEEPKVLKNLSTLIKAVKMKLDEVQATIAPPPQPAPVMVPEGAAGAPIAGPGPMVAPPGPPPVV